MDEAYSPLELLLFGTPEVRVDGVSVQRALSHKGVLLLAFLALYSGRPVSTSVIADAVFPDSQSEDPHEVIKKIVQQVRRALGEEAYRLSTPAPRMLALDLEGALCDWRTFHSMCRESRPESLRHAVALHARPFVETEIYGWIGAEQARCLRLRQEALETLFKQALESTDLASAAQCLSEQLLFDSSFITLKEALWRELYALLLQRQEFGLFHLHYLQLRAFLERTAGREPESETQALYQKIPKAVLIQILKARERPKKSGLPDTARLPSFPFALLGREEQKRELKATFPASRLWTVTGLGGIGKTRFTVAVGPEIATDLKAEVGFIDLIPASAETLLQIVAATLGIKESLGIPLSRSLMEFLFPKRVLLILDNCEHLIEAVAELSAELLKGCPNLHLLCTSRETLRIDGERVFPLQPLTVPSLALTTGSSPTQAALQSWLEADAVRLFCERAAAARPDFQGTSQNALLVVELCRLTDGLPLGIEMVASQVSTAPLERIVAMLTDCILHLQHHKRGIPARHQTLLFVLDWSYSILSEAEQRLFRRLSVFSGGWTLEAAEAICADESLPAEEISLLLSDLASKSLLTLAAADTGALRFSFLETVRVYAEDQLRLASERERFRQRHLDYFVALAEDAGAQLSGKDQKEALERLDREYGNLRRGLQISLETEIVSGLRLGYGLARYWETRGSIYEGQEWVSALLAQTDATDRTNERARVLDTAGWFKNILGDYQQANALLEESLAIFRGQGNRRDASISLGKLGIVAQNQGDLPKAHTLLEETLTLQRELGEPRLIALVLCSKGDLLLQGEVASASETALARAIFEEALVLTEESGDHRTKARCLLRLANLAYWQPDLPRAHSLGTASLGIMRELGDIYSIRYALHQLGRTAFALEDFEAAFSCYWECLALNREIKAPLLTGISLEALANLAAKKGQWERAARLWGAADRLMREQQWHLNPPAQERRDQLSSLAQAALSTEAYAQRFEEGKAMSADEAVEIALESKAL